MAFLLLGEWLSGLTEHWKMILGPLLVLIVLLARGGLLGLAAQVAAWWRRETIHSISDFTWTFGRLVRSLASSIGGRLSFKGIKFAIQLFWSRIRG